MKTFITIASTLYTLHLFLVWLWIDKNTPAPPKKQRYDYLLDLKQNYIIITETDTKKTTIVAHEKLEEFFINKHFKN